MKHNNEYELESIWSETTETNKYFFKNTPYTTTETHSGHQLIFLKLSKKLIEDIMTVNSSEMVGTTFMDS